MVRQGSSSASHIWMHTWEVVWEFYSGPFHRYREIDEKNLHCFFMSSYLKAWEQKLWQLLLRCLEISPENFGLHHTIHLSVYHEPRTKVKAFGNWAVVGYQPWPVLVLLPLVPHLVPSYCAGQGPAGWERAIAVLPSQLWRAEHSSRLGEGLKVEMVSQERCVSQEELLALLGLQEVMPAWGQVWHTCWCVRDHFIELKPVWGQILWQACTCTGTCRAAPSHAFFLCNFWFVQSASFSSSQGSNTQCAGSAFLGNNQNNFCAVFSLHGFSWRSYCCKEKILSAFSGMKYTVSIHVKPKSLTIHSRFCRCILLVAIHYGCEHNNEIKSRMQAYE